MIIWDQSAGQPFSFLEKWQLTTPRSLECYEQSNLPFSNFSTRMLVTAIGSKSWHHSPQPPCGLCFLEPMQPIHGMIGSFEKKGVATSLQHTHRSSKNFVFSHDFVFSSNVMVQPGHSRDVRRIISEPFTGHVDVARTLGLGIHGCLCWRCSLRVSRRCFYQGTSS